MRNVLKRIFILQSNHWHFLCVAMPLRKTIMIEGGMFCLIIPIVVEQSRLEEAKMRLSQRGIQMLVAQRFISSQFFWNFKKLEQGRIVGICILILYFVYLIFKISLILFDSCFLLNGFSINPLQPFSSIFLASLSKLKPLEISTFTPGLISFNLSYV